jgi:hypothetical protein
MNFAHPLIIACFAVVLVAAACLASNRAAVTEYRPAELMRVCMERVRHTLHAPADPNASIQLSRIASAIALLSALQTLAPDKATVVRETRIDPTAAKTSLHQAAAALLGNSGIDYDAFLAACTT